MFLQVVEQDELKIIIERGRMAIFFEMEEES
jgi:hypothetical protein